MSSDSRRFRQVFRPSPKVSGQSRGRRRARVPRLELLEDRTLLSITTKVNVMVPRHAARAEYLDVAAALEEGNGKSVSLDVLSESLFHAEECPS